jgi:hypothetical protein
MNPCPRHEAEDLKRQLTNLRATIDLLEAQQSEWRDVLDEVFQGSTGRPAIGDSKIEGVLKLARAYEGHMAKGPRAMNIKMGQDISHADLEKADYCFSFKGIPLRYDPAFETEDTRMSTPTPILPFTSLNGLAEVLVSGGHHEYTVGGVLGVAKAVELWDKTRLNISYRRGPAEEPGKITALSLARLQALNAISCNSVRGILDHIPLWPHAIAGKRTRMGSHLEALLDYLAPEKPAPKTYGDLALRPGDKVVGKAFGTYIVTDASASARDSLTKAWGVSDPSTAVITCHPESGDLRYFRTYSSLSNCTRITRRDGTQIYPVPDAPAR